MSEQASLISGKAIARYMDHLRHMLGVDNYRKTMPGYRNYFCASVESSDYRDMLVMQQLGLVEAGHKINSGKSQYFFATRKGCEAVGLNEEQITRAMEQ